MCNYEMIKMDKQNQQSTTKAPGVLKHEEAHVVDMLPTKYKVCC